MKKAIFAASLFVVSVLLFFGEEIVVGGGRVAKVNSTIITMAEIKDAKKRAELSGMEYSKKQLLSEIIKLKLLVARAKKEGVKLNTAKFKRELEMTHRQFEQMRIQVNPSYKFTEEDFKQYVENVIGIKFENFLENMKEQALARQYILKIVEPELLDLKAESLSDRELEDFYNANISNFVRAKSVELKQIFLKTMGLDGVAYSDKEKEIVRAKCEKVLARLKKGEKFGNVCLEVPEDPQSRDALNPETKKTDRGYFGKFPLVGPYADAFKSQFGATTLTFLFDQKVGSFSDIIESKYGYHIFYVIGKTEARLVPFSEVKPSLSTYLKRKKEQELFMEKYNGMIKKLLDSATVKYYNKDYKPE